MSRSKEYQRLLNDKRWKVLRSDYLRDHPLCERCLAEGYYVPAIDCHHKVPVETATTPQEMERLAYDAHNLQALCIPCHKKVHRELRSQTREGHQQAADNNLERWKARKKGRPTPEENS